MNRLRTLLLSPPALMLLAACTATILGTGHRSPRRWPWSTGIAVPPPDLDAAPRTGGGTAPGMMLAGMPPPLSDRDVYAADRAGMFSPAVRGHRALVYVPNTNSDTP
jgi:hypothetical protein